MLKSIINKLRETTLPASSLIGLLIVVLLLSLFAASAAMMDDNSQERARQIAEDAIRRAAVTCYAIEGCYHPNYAYLAENYNVSVDPEKFIVYYSTFATNIMPSISVIPVKGE